MPDGGHPTLDAGTVLGGLYQLVALVGRGTYSTYAQSCQLLCHLLTWLSSVWRARQLKTSSNDPVAVKIVPKHGDEKPAPPAFQSIEKEALLHRTVDHPNIVAFIDLLEDAQAYYLVQEFCEGGELFERLEPDVGFPEAVAHFYFAQLLDAVSHLHQRGICHRDLKPENLLLDMAGNLKVADFGLATLFRKGDRRRTLQTRCGSLLYMAPEVLTGSYEGDQVDLWSCAMVLVVMLLGCHPWEEPTSRCPSFRRFAADRSHLASISDRWGELDGALCSLLLSMLSISADSRPDLSQIYASSWMRQPNRLLGTQSQCADPALLLWLTTLRRPEQEGPTAIPEFGRDDGLGSDLMIESLPALTQPEIFLRTGHGGGLSQSPRVKAARPHFWGFSQPSLQSLLVSPRRSRAGGGSDDGGASSTPRPPHYPRVSHSFCSMPARNAMERIKLVLDQLLVGWRSSPIPLHLAINTVDRRKAPITAQAMAIKVSHHSCMVVLQKYRGDWLEFKRLARLILAQLQGGPTGPRHRSSQEMAPTNT